MTKAILKLDKTITTATQSLNSQLVVGDKLLWESRKGKTIKVGNGIRLGEVAASKLAEVKLVVKTRTYSTKVAIPASAKKLVITVKISGLQRLIRHIPFYGKIAVAAALVAGKGVKLTAKTK